MINPINHCSTKVPPMAKRFTLVTALPVMLKGKIWRACASNITLNAPVYPNTK